MTGDNRLESLLKNAAEQGAWIDAFSLAEIQDTGYRPSVGATYLKSNIDRLVQRIGDAKIERPITEIIWLRPSGSSWARTTRVVEALTEIRDALRNKGHSDVRSVLTMPRSTSRPTRLTHKRVFDRGVLLPQGHLPSNLEVLLIPGVVALVNIHVPVQQHSVPVGGMVSNARRIGRIAERLGAINDPDVEELWHRQTGIKGAAVAAESNN